MTFKDLSIGDRFVFSHERRPQDIVTPKFCVKTGDRTFDGVWPDDSVIRGRVGVGDNPVERLLEQ